MSATPPITVRPTDCCQPSCDDVVVSQVPGPSGADGAAGAAGSNGVNAYTTTTAGFTMPAIAATVNVAVVVSSWASIGQVVHISGAGYFTVTAKPDATHITVSNLGYTGNAAPAAIIAGSQSVSPGGLVGPTGSSGVSTLNSISPTTTKGDLMVDNGANSPLASVVRLGVGTSGQMIAAVPAQPTGLMWQTTLPIVATDNGIPRFDGAAGTPIPLQTSFVVITDAGAIRASGSGGNARGTDAVDLQVVRGAVTQVASGVESFIGGGENNTASGADSVVCGGSTNAATGDTSCIAGGVGNTASSDFTSITGGSSNLANGDYGVVAGGNNNTAGNLAFVGGGNDNAAAASCSVIGGSTNIASGTVATIGGGADNAASGDFSCVPGGSRAIANHHGQIAHASGRFTGDGDAQHSHVIYRGITTNVTPTEIFLDGTSIQLLIPADTTWAFRALVSVRRTDVNDESAAYQLLGCIDRNATAGTTALVGSVTKTVIAEDTAAWDINATADVATGALAITVTGENAKTIRWVVVMEITHVTG